MRIAYAIAITFMLTAGARAAMISQQQAEVIAIERAKGDEYGMFKTPYLENTTRRKDNGHWVVKLLSFKPSPHIDCEMYMYVTIAEDGRIVAVDSGGGS